MCSTYLQGIQNVEGDFECLGNMKCTLSGNWTSLYFIRYEEN